MDTQVERRSVAVDQIELSWLEAGDPNGMPIVLLHGIPASAELFRDVLPLLAEAGYRALAPDLIGYGRTIAPEDADHSLEASAATVTVWLGQEGVAPVWLVGHDLGGAVAQIIITQTPVVVNRLTLSDTVAGDNWPVTSVKLFRKVAKAGIFPALAAARLIPNPYVRHQMRRAFARPERYDRDEGTRVFWGDKVSTPIGRRAFARHLVTLDTAPTVAAAARLDRVSIPTLLLWGDSDRFQPWETSGARLMQLLPHADTEVIPDGGHFVPLERPEAFAHALLAWRARS